MKLPWNERHLLPLPEICEIYFKVDNAAPQRLHHHFLLMSSTNKPIKVVDLPVYVTSFIEIIDQSCTAIAKDLNLQPLYITEHHKGLHYSVSLFHTVHGNLQVEVLFPIGQGTCNVYCYYNCHEIKLPLCEHIRIDLFKGKTYFAEKVQALKTAIIKGLKTINLWQKITPRTVFPEWLLIETVLSETVAKEYRCADKSLSKRSIRKVHKHEVLYNSYLDFYTDVCRTIDNIGTGYVMLSKKFSISFGNHYRRKLAARFRIDSYFQGSVSEEELALVTIENYTL